MLSPEALKMSGTVPIPMTMVLELSSRITRQEGCSSQYIWNQEQQGMICEDASESTIRIAPIEQQVSINTLHC